jgi:hypothetical protein
MACSNGLKAPSAQSEENCKQNFSSTRVRGYDHIGVLCSIVYKQDQETELTFRSHGALSTAEILGQACIYTGRVVCTILEAANWLMQLAFVR